MKRQLHTRSKNLLSRHQSTIICFVEFQFTAEMLWCKCRSAGSQIPDRLRLGVRGRVDVDCSRRDSEDSVDPDDVRGGRADCMAAPPQPCFSISHLLVTFSSVSRYPGELQALSIKAESSIFMYFLLFLFHPFPESLGGQSLNFTQPCFLISHLSPSVSGFLGTFHQMAPSSIFYVFLLLISIASLDTRVITMSFSLCSNLPQNVVE